MVTHASFKLSFKQTKQYVSCCYLNYGANAGDNITLTDPVAGPDGTAEPGTATAGASTPAGKALLRSTSQQTDPTNVCRVAD